MARAELRILTSADRPPPIIQLGPSNQTLKAGSKAEMPCMATSQGGQIVWLKDGVPLGISGDRRFNKDNDNTLVIKGEIIIFGILILR